MTGPVVSITRLEADQLDELEPLWNSLREHHGEEFGATYGPVRPRTDSWTLRREFYEGCLAQEGSFALLARDGETAVGYAMVVVSRPTHIWRHDRPGCLETLSVLPAARGQGLGSRLITEARAGLAGQGIEVMTIAVIAGNDDALRFYRRHGFDPCVTIVDGPTVPLA